MKNWTDKQKALLFIFSSAILYALIPLIIHKGDADAAPFLFNGWLKIGESIGAIIFLCVVCRSFISDSVVWQVFRKGVRSRHFMLLIIGFFGYTAFSWSVIYIDIAIASILFDTWPIFFVIYLNFLLRRREGGDNKTPPSSYLLMIFGFFGVAFAIVSQHGNFEFSDKGFQDLLYGFLFSMLAVVLVTIIAHNFILALELKDEYNKIKGDKNQLKNNNSLLSITAMFSVLIYSIATVISSCLNFIIGLLFDKIDFVDIINIGESVSYRSFFIAFFGGMIVIVLGSVFRRTANALEKDSPEINAISYLTPIFAILFLYWFGEIEVERFDYFIIGAIIIVISNLLINLSASVRLGYKTLIIALWVFGTFAYFHVGIQITVSTYFNIIFIVNTMYILVLSFRLDRFVRRTSNEENRALLLLENINKCIRLKLLKKDARQWLRKIDAPKGINDLFESYKKMKTILYKAKKNASDKESSSDIDRIAKIDNEIDMLALSKQQGGNFGELVAMAILGIISIAITLFAYPKGICGVDGFAVKLFAMLLSTIVVFLFANIVDLWIDRDYPIMKKYKNTSEYKWKFGVEFRDTESRSFERWVSSLVCVAIIGIYGYFLWQEWGVVGGGFACNM